MRVLTPRHRGPHGGGGQQDPDKAEQPKQPGGESNWAQTRHESHLGIGNKKIPSLKKE